MARLGLLTVERDFQAAGYGEGEMACNSRSTIRRPSLVILEAGVRHPPSDIGSPASNMVGLAFWKLEVVHGVGGGDFHKGVWRRGSPSELQQLGYFVLGVHDPVTVSTQFAIEEMA